MVQRILAMSRMPEDSFLLSPFPIKATFHVLLVAVTVPCGRIEDARQDSMRSTEPDASDNDVWNSPSHTLLSF